MPNINLSTENVSKKSPNLIGSGLVFVTFILILLIVLYGGLILANRGLSSKIKAVQGEYDVEYDKFLAGNSSEILDFKNRSDIAKEVLLKNKSMADALSQIESSVLPSVYLNSLEYDKKKNSITIFCVGDSFQTVAKQVLSFKQNDYFSAVMLGSSSVDPENGNKLNFDINLIIK